MAVVRGPLQSLSAAGTIGAALTFARRGRSTTAYARTRPSQPRTPAQIGRRVMFAFLGSQWPFIAAVDQQTWLPKFGDPQPYAFLHYQSVNLARWTAFLAPSQASPPTEATTPNGITTLTATPFQGYVQLRFAQMNPPRAWGWILFRDTTLPMNASPHNLVQIWPAIGSGTFVRIDYPVPPGTWHYRLGNFSPDGKLIIWRKAENIVVP